MMKDMPIYVLMDLIMLIFFSGESISFLLLFCTSLPKKLMGQNREESGKLVTELSRQG